jgi:hypothetical protein
VAGEKVVFVGDHSRNAFVRLDIPRSQCFDNLAFTNAFEAAAS